MLRSKTLVAVTILTALLSNLSVALAGGEVSGGADSYIIAPAFFRSSDVNKKINLCYEVAAQFGVPNAEIENVLRWAFSQWDSYIEAKDLHYAIWTGSPGIVGKLGDVHSGCHGSEDLRVYFGIENADVAKYRPRFVNPYAFSAITDPSAGGDWNKGFLWFAGPGAVDSAKGIPTWNQTSPIAYGALKYTVLHEIGHIFGNGHVDWTIMTSRIGDWLAIWTNPTEKYYFPREANLRIDQQSELVPNLNLQATYPLATEYGCLNVDGRQTCPDPEALAKAFKRIFGKNPVGKISATAMRLENPNRKLHSRPDDVAEGTGPLDLVFVDDRGTHPARIITRALVAQKDESTPLFNGQHGNHYRSFGASFSGYIEGPSAQQIPVLVNYNMGKFLTVIDLAGGGLNHPLLTSE